MADIGLSAFALFFMGSPSFLAHQRVLEEGLGRSNCETLFAMSAIPSDNYIRLMLDGAPSAAFDGLLQAIEAAGPLTPFRCLDRRVQSRLMGPSTSARARSNARNVRRAGARMAARNTATPSSVPAWSHRAISRCCHCRRSLRHVPLHRPTAGDPAVLHGAPMTVLLAILRRSLWRRNMALAFQSQGPFQLHGVVCVKLCKSSFQVASEVSWFG